MLHISLSLHFLFFNPILLISSYPLHPVTYPFYDPPTHPLHPPIAPAQAQQLVDAAERRAAAAEARATEAEQRLSSQSSSAAAAGGGGGDAAALAKAQAEALRLRDQLDLEQRRSTQLLADYQSAKAELQSAKVRGRRRNWGMLGGKELREREGCGVGEIEARL